MDVQLGNLIEKLRQEGVEEAQRTAEEILNQARSEAEGITAEARAEADRIVSEARAETARLQENGELALKQAGRDAELLLKSTITDLFDRVFTRSVATALTPETMQKMIVQLVTGWKEGGTTEIALNPDDLKVLEEQLFAAIGEEMTDGITLTPSDDVAHGFRIGRKGENAWYDFTDESIAESLRLFLQPRLKEILDETDG